MAVCWHRLSCLLKTSQSSLPLVGNGAGEQRLPSRGSSEAVQREPGDLPHTVFHHRAVGAAELPALRGGHAARQDRRGAQWRAGERSRSAEEGEDQLLDSVRRDKRPDRNLLCEESVTTLKPLKPKALIFSSNNPGLMLERISFAFALVPL